MSHDEFFLSYIKSSKPGPIPLWPYEFKDYHLKKMAQKIKITDGCWEWTASFTTTGYPNLAVRRRSGSRKAHRTLMSILFDKDLTPKDFVCHHCDNPKCLRPSHLYIGDAKSNMGDMIRRGRKINYWKGKHGQRGQGTVYSEEVVRKAITLYSQGVLVKEIPALTGIKSMIMVSLIVRGIIWKNLWPFTIGSRDYSLEEIRKMNHSRRKNWRKSLPQNQPLIQSITK